MKKRLVSFILVLVMILGLMPTVAFAANTTEFAGGSGTEADPYLISTKHHLDNVRNYLDSHFKMIADIEFTDADFAEGGDFYNSGKGFEPIATDLNSQFTGTFDGNGHAIKNLYINISSTESKVYAGLFGCNKGTIKNLGMLDGTVSATSLSSSDDGYTRAGSIVGYNGGTITNCYNTGSVSALALFAYVGGIAGINDEGTISNCYNTGNISSSYYAAGISGENSYATIENCYNTGRVTAGFSSSSAIAGGIVGDNFFGTIENCYNTGNILASVPYSSVYSGGIAGINTYRYTITNCYNTGEVFATSSSYYIYAGGIVGYSSSTITSCYYLDIISKGYEGSTDAATKCTVDEMKQQSTFVGFDFENIWEFVEGNAYSYPTLKNNEHFLIDENAEFQGGDGTESAPYLIASAKQLNNVRNYLDAHFKLVRDIEFTDEDFAEGGAFYNDGQGWMPIGASYNSAFTGALDGDGHAIKNLYIKISSSSDVCAGLFGYNKGTIKNLGMVDGTVSAMSSASFDNAYAGGITGDNHSGTIENCYNTGTVSAMSSADSYDNAYAGGITGNNYSGTIEKCYNTGKVSTSDYAGGIAGIHTGIITNCYNTGEVSVSSYKTSVYAGGIMGSSKGTTTNCYNIGKVSAPTYSSALAGGIAGYDTGMIKNCYYLDNISKGVDMGTGTATKCTADQLKNQLTFVGFDFENFWTMSGDECYPYPELKDIEFTSDHVYDNACDTDCDCGNLRVTTHSFGEYIYDNNATYEADGTKTATCSVCGETDTVTAEGTKLQKDGWAFENGKWYFYEKGIAVKNTWKKDSTGWCYLDSDGSMATNKWVRDSIGWCYVGADGYAVTNCWKKDSVGWCYLNSEGSMTKNAWVLDGGKWYFLDSDGYMVSNTWRQDSKGWCYLGSDGAMATNKWIKDSQGWCYVGKDGYCITNSWMKDSVGWCYLDAEGRMVVNDWVRDSQGLCWLDSNGYWNGIYH